MPTANKSKTAATAYTESRKRVDGLLEQLTSKLQNHQARQKRDPRNWGFAGDMDHYADLLEQLLGIEYRADIDRENREVTVTRKSDGAMLNVTFDEIDAAKHFGLLGRPVLFSQRSDKDLADAAISLAQTFEASYWG